MFGYSMLWCGTNLHALESASVNGTYGIAPILIAAKVATTITSEILNIS